MKFLEKGNKFQTFYSFRQNPCPFGISTSPCECSKTHLVPEMGTTHRDFWLFYKVCEEINNLIISVLKSTEYDILVLTDLETICDICLKFSLFLHYFCALLNKELSSGNSICQNLPHGHDIGKLDFILTLQAYCIWYKVLKKNLGN